MDQIVLVILLVLGVPLVAGIWLIWRAVHARQQIEELGRRVDDLQLELAKLKRTAPAAPETAEETVPVLVPAPLPPRREEPAVTPPPIMPVAEPPPAVVPPPRPIFPGWLEPSGEAVPAPPVIPPLPQPARAVEPTPEPAWEAAQASAAVAATPSSGDEKDSFEMRVGKFWAVRFGVVIILTALAFGANLAYHNLIPKLGAAEKVSLLYLASGLMLAAGAWWQRRNVKESLKNYAQVLFAGGLAAVYFTTYAAHYAPAVSVIPSALLDGTLLLVWAGVIAWIADRRKSEVMALFAVGLAFFTSVITRVGEFTLCSNLILTLAAVLFLVRNRWAGLSFASLLTSYAGYAFWRFLHADGWHWATPGENLWLGAGFLAAYWLVFTAATFLSRSERLSGANRAAFLTLNNGAYFGLFLLTMLQVHTGGFWKFSLIYGAVLLALAVFARRFLPSEPLTKNAYLTHGLVLVTLGLISRFTGLQLALVLGAESVVLYVLATQRRSDVLKFFGYAAALLATGWCVAASEALESPNLWMGVGLGALLVFNAWWAHRETVDHPQPLRVEPTVFTLLAFAAWLTATWANSSPEHLPLVLAAEAVALTCSIYCLRVREITLLGQGFLILAQLAWMVHFLALTPPWWNPLLLIAVTLGLSHWWQHQKTLVISRKVYGVGSGVFALAVVAMAIIWFHPLVSPPAWLVLTSLLAVAVTGYGLFTRAWALAICGQVFLAVSAWEFLQQVLRDLPEWYFPLAPVAALAVFSVGAIVWFARESQAASPARGPLLRVALVYRWLALAMSLPWIWNYIPERQHVWFFMLAAMVVFPLGVWRQSREALAAAAVYAVASVGLLWLRENLMMDVYGPNLLALLALLAMQQTLRRAAARLPLDETVHGAMVVVAGLSLWRFLTCWTALVGSGFLVTMTWAGFAVVMFAAGILRHERFLRWFGLGVLASAVGRVVLVDVWKQETGYRVLTFMALGVALLVVGFIYNKYQEKIRQWL